VRLDLRQSPRPTVGEHHIRRTCNPLEAMLADNLMPLLSRFRGRRLFLGRFGRGRARGLFLLNGTGVGRWLLLGGLFALAAGAQAEEGKNENWDQKSKIHGYSP
jgi:hypothetical protein